MDKTNFYLEIYEPGTSDVVGSWPMAMPVTVSVGDVLHLGALVPNEPPRSVRAIAIEHAMWPRDGVLAHKLMVFTEEA